MTEYEVVISIAVKASSVDHAARMAEESIEKGFNRSGVVAKVIPYEGKPVTEGVDGEWRLILEQQGDGGCMDCGYTLSCRDCIGRYS